MKTVYLLLSQQGQGKQVGASYAFATRNLAQDYVRDLHPQVPVLPWTEKEGKNGRLWRAGVLSGRRARTYTICEYMVAETLDELREYAEA